MTGHQRQGYRPHHPTPDPEDSMGKNRQDANQLPNPLKGSPWAETLSWPVFYFPLLVLWYKIL